MRYFTTKQKLSILGISIVGGILDDVRRGRGFSVATVAINVGVTLFVTLVLSAVWFLVVDAFGKD